MSTLLYDLVDNTESRWQEVNLLIEKAEEERERDTAYYDALCRAISVLIVAQFESYIKDITKYIIYDVNAHSSYKASPYMMKRIFCKTFVDESMLNGEQIEARVKLLNNTFDALETKFEVAPFLAESEQGNPKNPSPTIIAKICKNFGAGNIFSWLKSPQIDIVFEDSTSDTELLIKALRTHVLEKTQVCPYITDISAFGITEPSSKDERSKEKSLYETFLNELLRNRHAVAHGSSSNNNASIEELIQARNKVIVLGYVLMLVLAHNIGVASRIHRKIEEENKQA